MNKKRNPQKRGGFVPIGDVADGLSLPGGRALTHRAATPQARHHFTRLDQIDQLVAASEADADLGFMARLLALCSLPRTNPKQRLQYCTAPGSLDTHLCYAAWRSSYSSRASIGV